MKIMKRIAAFMLALCLTVPCFAMVADAADGRISFSDPSAEAGANVSVNCKTQASSGTVGDVTINLTYDSSALSFISGDGVTKNGDGNLTYTGKGSSSELRFTMQFQALKQGTTKIEIASYTATTGNGDTLTCKEGSSTITVQGGTEVTATTTTTTTASGSTSVEVDGTQYTFFSDFADRDLPTGFTKAEITYDGQQFTVAQQEGSGTKLGWLVDSANNGSFFLYNEEDATFAPYIEVAISDETSIILLRNSDEVSLPDNYQEVKLTMNQIDFPAWQDPSKEGFYLMYAINNMGEKGFYQYDDNEKTYQRYIPEEVEEEKKDTSFLGKLTDSLQDHLNMVVLGGGLGGLLALIIIVVLGVKLHNRNAELDELYDEYGIDLEDEEPAPKKTEAKTKKNKKDQFKKKWDDEDEFESELDEDEDYDYDRRAHSKYDDYGYDDEEDYGYDDDDNYGDDNYDDDDYSYDDDGYDDDDYGYDDDDYGYDDGYGKKRDRYGDDDDSYDIDFLDL